MNAENYTRKSLEAVQTAQAMAQENHNNYITPEHGRGRERPPCRA